MNESSPPDETREPLPFSIKLRKLVAAYYLFGTLSEIIEEMVTLIPCYSLDGENYILKEDMEWQVYRDEPSDCTQICLGPFESPLEEYFSEEINAFYVKLKIIYEDGTERWTQEGLIKRNAEIQPLPEGEPSSLLLSASAGWQSLLPRSKSGCFTDHHLCLCRRQCDEKLRTYTNL